MFKHLEDINSRPEPFEFYTAADLWTDKHTSEQMLAYHLNTGIDVSSRQGEFIDQWLQHFSSESLQSEFEEAGFVEYELYSNVAGASFDETALEFAIVGRK